MLERHVMPRKTKTTPAPKLSSIQMIHNDTCQRVEVWWQPFKWVLGGAEVNRPTVQEFLHPSKSTNWFEFEDHAQKVCVRYKIPQSQIIQEKCKKTWSPTGPQQKGGLIVKVSDVIGPGIIPAYTSKDLEAAAAEEAAVAEVEAEEEAALYGHSLRQRWETMALRFDAQSDDENGNVQSMLFALEPSSKRLEYFIPGLFALAFFWLMLVGLKTFCSFSGRCRLSVTTCRSGSPHR